MVLVNGVKVVERVQKAFCSISYESGPKYMGYATVNLFTKKPNEAKR